jgi:hypothetical protein
MSIHRTEKVVQFEQPSGGSPHKVLQVATPLGGFEIVASCNEIKNGDGQHHASQLATHRQAERIKITERVPLQVATKPQGGHQPDAYRPMIVSVRRAVAIAKLVEFENQALLLGGYVSADMLPRPVAADALHDVALANDLTSIHGDDLIQTIIAAGLSGGCL